MRGSPTGLGAATNQASATAPLREHQTPWCAELGRLVRSVLRLVCRVRDVTLAAPQRRADLTERQRLVHGEQVVVGLLAGRATDG